ncbi:hypothetical protein [Kribbella speibonae]|uniref:Uncharacterized protein n=1 Tax=Kribbella speibonae TaxID=1572660 RepID=A0A4R0IZG8_9ACTN|nr:hypothetical protein [Kribbella speibonae]TCC38727.1 hypothetical protein E0H92_20235 [Kribbella speibonae]
MIDDLAKLLDKVSSPADLAVILLSGPLAYLLDAGVDVVHFLPPGYVAVLTASFALGMKKAAEVGTTARRDRQRTEKRRLEVQERVAALDARITEYKLEPDLAVRLRRELDLYEAGITSDTEFDAAFAVLLARFRRYYNEVLDSEVGDPRR